MTQEFADSIQFRDYMQPINEMAYVGAAVLAYWDGNDKNTFRFFYIEAKIPYIESGFPTNQRKLDTLLEAKEELVNGYNTEFLKGMKPFRLEPLLDEHAIRNLYGNE